MQQDVLSTPQQSFHRTPKGRKRKPASFSNFSIEPLLADDFYGWHAVIWDAGMP